MAVIKLSTRKRRRPKRWVIVCVSLLAILIIVSIGGGYYLFDYALSRNNTSMIGDVKTEVEEQAELLDQISADDYEWALGQPLEKLSITSDDGLQLRAVYLPSQTATNKTVILAHGYRAHSGLKNLAPLVRMYHEQLGYNVLSLDERAHGESEGELIGFGWADRLDYVRWIDLMIEKNGADQHIVLHGVSMGGATVLMTSGESLPSQVKAVISDCAFVSMNEQLSYQLKEVFGLPAFPLLPIASGINKLQAGFFFGEASSLKQVKKSKVPILFIHGEADTYVPFEMVNRLYEAKTGDKELFVVPGAAHGKAYIVDPAPYTSATEQFLSRYIK